MCVLKNSHVITIRKIRVKECVKKSFYVETLKLICNPSSAKSSCAGVD